MRSAGGDIEFTRYVSARALWLRKVAYLLCGDWHRADDLVQTAVTKLYVNWHRAGKVANLDGYARTVLINTFLAEQRSPWWRSVVLLDTNDAAVAVAADLDTGLDLRTALAQLPARQRVAVVLRYYCDLSIDETAQEMSCSAGTVKSQAARGLDKLRALMTIPPVVSHLER